jgi:branched-chain amino acid transport system ATP-binding protein
LKLEVTNLQVSYGAVQAVRDVSFSVDSGEILTIVGPNGAGKSSILMTVLGVNRRLAQRGRATLNGSVRLGDAELLGRPTDEIVRLGIGIVPEGRRIFGELTVEENLIAARAARRDRKAAELETARLLERFPALGQSRNRHAGLLSGGQQQQLSIARALLTRPQVLLMDEPSLGLAPLVIEEVLHIVQELREEGLSVLLLEQNALQAMEIADRAMLLRNGELSDLDTGRDGQMLIASYFGLDRVKV